MLALFPLFFTSAFIPHGHCYLWKPELVLLHLVSDSLIALAYYSIPLTLVYFVRKRRDIPFDWIFLLFGAFIIACGTTHILAVWTLWHPNYWISGFIKAITACVSVYTAVELVTLIPQALTLPSPAQLEEANHQLEKALSERTIAEAELQKALQRLSFHVENSPLAVIEWDNQSRVQRWSPQAENLFGWKAEEVLGRHIDELQLVFAEDIESVNTIITHLLNGSTPRYVSSNRNYTKDRSVIYCEWYNSALRDETGNLVSILSLALDITTRKLAEDALKQAKEELEVRVEERTGQLQQVNDHLVVEIQERWLAEKALRQSETRLNLALSAAQMVAWDWDLQQGRLNWSDGVETLFGLTPGTFGGTYEAFLNYLHPEDRPEVAQALNYAIEAGTDYEVESRICCPDGTIRWIASKGAVLRNPTGQAVGLTGTVMDITKRKQVELALERERQQLRQIITCAPVAMAMFDTEMRYLAYSQKWLTVQGLEEQSILNRSHYEVFLDLPEHWKQIHQRALAGEIIANPEDIWERADGSIVYLRWAIHPWYTAEGQIGGIVIATDRINELVEAREAALEAAQFKSQFLANMSHEIRTPMNGVLGMAELLLQTPLTPQQLDYGRTIRSSAEHLLMVINDILDFSKLEAGEMHVEKLDFDLDSCLESVVDVLARQAEQKGLELAILVESNVPRQLQGDAGRLRQILLNLVSNAIKFTDVGEVVVKATLELEGSEELEGSDHSSKVQPANLPTYNLQPATQIQPANGVRIRFEVTDTGIGIAAEDQQKLFRSFSQLDASSTRQYGGTGLGLVICKQLVELMEGEIGVESALGQGSTFWFTTSFGKQTAPTKKAISPVLSKLKLLVVDAHATTRQAVRHLAEAWGMQVDEAADSTTALRVLRSSAECGQPYDVALLDLQLLHKQGTILVPMIRSDPTLSQTKLILLTTMQQREQAESLKSMDVSGYLLKPIRASRLLDSLTCAFTYKISSSYAATDDASGMAEPTLTFHAERGHSLLMEHGSTLVAPELTDRWETADGRINQASGDRILRRNLKILLVEDHPVNQTVILNQLQMLGYEAECVGNGKEAIAQLQEKNYDIVLMDCQMPILDGYETTKELRRREGSQRHTVVIALTAHAMPTDRNKCLAAGMDDYLTKPIEQEALGLMIERWAKPNATTNVMNTTSKVENTPQPSVFTMDGTPLDLERLDRISRGKVAVQQRLLQLFIENTQPGLEKMRLALQGQDFATVEQQAHRIKGSSANVGVLLMPDVAAQLERQARDKTLEGATERVEALERQLEQVKAFLKAGLTQRS